MPAVRRKSALQHQSRFLTNAVHFDKMPTINSFSKRTLVNYYLLMTSYSVFICNSGRHFSFCFVAQIGGFVKTLNVS